MSCLVLIAKREIKCFSIYVCISLTVLSVLWVLAFCGSHCKRTIVWHRLLTSILLHFYHCHVNCFAFQALSLCFFLKTLSFMVSVIQLQILLLTGFRFNIFVVNFFITHFVSKKRAVLLSVITLVFLCCFL